MANPIASLVVQLAVDTAEVRTGVEKTNTLLDGFGTKMTGLGSIASKAMGVVGVALSAGAIKDYALDLMETASRYEDVAKKANISTEAAQRFGHAAEMGGSTLEAVDRSLIKMSDNLAGGGDSVRASLSAVGLSFDAIRAMDPEDAFLAITDAIRDVPDPMRQADLAMQLFGKSGTELLPAIRDGFREVGSQVSVMSDETIASLTAADDQLQLFLKNLKAWSAEALGAVASSYTKAVGFVEKATLVVTQGWTEGRRIYAEQQQMAATTATIVEGAEKTKAEEARRAKAAYLEQAEATKRKEDADKKAADAARQHAAEISKLRESLTGLDSVNAAKNLLEAARGLDLTTLSAENTKSALDTLNDAIDALRGQGKAVPGELQAMRDALAQIAAQAKLTEIALEPIALLKVDPSGERVLRGITSEIDAAADASKRAAAQWEKDAAAALAQWRLEEDYRAKQQAAAKEQAATLDATLKTISTGFAQMSQVSGGAFGKVSQGIGSTVSMVSTAKDGFGALKTGVSALIGAGGAGASAAGATGMLGMASTIGLCATGVGAIIPVAMLAFKGLNKVFGNAGRDMVKDFAKTFDGGFDGLQKRLQGFGAEGEAMWKKLTQGVPRNDKKAAEAAIKEVEAFLAQADQKFNDSLQRQLQGIREFGGAVPKELQPYLDTLLESGRITQNNIDLMKELSGGGEVSWQKMEEAANKYGIATDTLGERFQRQKLHEGWKELIDDAKLLTDGGADVTGMLVGMADEISELVIHSRKFGFEIPENMRKFIEPLIASGQLLDENGNKIEDINSLQFGAEIKDSMSELIEEIKKLVQTLGGVPPAIAAIPRSVDIDVNYRSRTYDTPDGESLPDVPQFAYGSGGLRDFGDGTLAMLHGREAVLTEHQMRRMGLSIGRIEIHAGSNASADDISASLTRELNRFAYRY